MPSHPLQDTLYQRLIAEGHDNAPWVWSLLAACEGAESLQQQLDDGVAPVKPGRRRARDNGAPAVPRAYLRAVHVRAFRGIGPQRSLELTPGPGLTLVCGRNGSGKSSFVEALEVLLTGTSTRWHDRQAAWRQGWRNLHEAQAPLIAAQVEVESIGSVTLSRKWPAEADLDQAETVAKMPDGTRPLAEIGWDSAAADYRPFLSYSELGHMLEDGRSALHDALLAGLGLDQFEVVRKRLSAAQSERKALQAQAKQEAVELRAYAESIRDATPDAVDARLTETVAALSAKVVDCDALERLATGTGAANAAVQQLTALLALSLPDPAVAADVVSGIRAAAGDVQRLAQQAAGRSLELADLLERALAVTADEAQAADCPVCRTPDVIDARWRTETTTMVAELRAAARDVHAARQALTAALESGRALCVAPPRLLDDDTVPLDLGDLRAAWAHLAAGQALRDPDTLATHLEQHLPAARTALETAHDEARRELARREDRWQPVAVRLAAWVETGRAAQRARDSITLLKSAEDWLKKAIDAIRRERFDPIVQQAVRYWSYVRLQSNVDLRDISLIGAGNRRTVSLDVSVDGSEAPALGVMSQGELNCLALSLFLPRATLPDSPFGFVVVDDPVQAMDPAKVEGLARALHEAARTHQVIVFTHDDRLPDAVRRLGLAARTLEVSRRTNSVVEIRRGEGPVESSLHDAVAVLQTPSMPLDIKRRLVPGFCRSALEAACAEAVRARRLAQGQMHHEVEQVLADARTLRRLVALTLFDTTEQEGQVEGRLSRSRVPQASETFHACLKGAHGGFDGDPDALLEGARRLTTFLRERVKVTG